MDNNTQDISSSSTAIINHIIALQGRYDSGKTSTLRLLPAMILANGYSLVDGKMPPPQPETDFWSVFNNGTLKVGVTSAGDRHDDLYEALEDLEKKGCNVCICACRTYGGTVAAVNSFPAYKVQFATKTIASSKAQEAIVNDADARNIFSRI